MKKRIGILYTGGTLGMTRSAQGFRPQPNWLETQLRALPALTHPSMPEFDVHEYSPLLDSSDIQPEHWQRMAQDIYSNYQQYDGFVVLHGTDTMAYSASAVHYLLENLAKPVIFTGAQIPLSEPNSDALHNVRNALYAAAFSNYQGVALLFAKRLLKGECATKFAAQDLDGFASFNSAPILTWDTEWLTLPPPIAIASDDKKLILKTINHKKIGVLTFYPGMDFSLLAEYFSLPWHGIVLHSFGSGNIPQHPVLWQALQAARARGVQFINCTQCKKGEVENKYLSGYLMAELGVIFAGEKTLENVVAWAQTDW